ncbi:MarR family winged helix-turn-helix transcriptional regulator [Actinomadura litoris]|uniref:MarR family winged helix-turn-helix transcriptional regulator n=1 Tax=Actinomadura litoris TaxID=2678616 RepID=UPI001FA6B639|nr:winged helix DNA-binding protein [Actinomadura litoris]
MSLIESPAGLEAEALLVTRLERDGLAVRSPDPSDGRAVLVRLTPAGAKVVESRRKERIDRLAARLDPDHQQALASSLPALLEMARLAAQPPNGPTAPLSPTQ